MKLSRVLYLCQRLMRPVKKMNVVILVAVLIQDTWNWIYVTSCLNSSSMSHRLLT